MQQINAVVLWLQANWPLIVAIATALSSIVATLITAMTNHPQAETWLHRISGALSWVEHADVGGFKWPFKKLTPPDQAKTPPAGPPPVLKVLMLGCALLAGRAEAQINWGSPVFYAGPTLLPFEEITTTGGLTNTSIAGGLQETLGFGQYQMFNKEWDVFDVGVLELGGLAVSGAQPAGQLQLGGKIGTFNGLVNFAVLKAFNANGGIPGVVLGVAIDITALLAYFSNPVADGKAYFIPRMARGGLGG